MTQTPASGRLALVTTPPMSSLSMATAGCCARAVTRNSDPTSARHAAAMVSSGFLVRGIFQSSVGCRKYHAFAQRAPVRASHFFAAAASNPARLAAFKVKLAIRSAEGHEVGAPGNGVRIWPARLASTTTTPFEVAPLSSDRGLITERLLPAAACPERSRGVALHPHARDLQHLSAVGLML